MRHTPLLATLALIVGAGGASPRAAAEKPAAPPAKITVDVSDAPEAKDWAEKARALCEKWYPIVSEELNSDGFTPPRRVKLVFKDEKNGIAATTGTTIHINVNWIKKRPDDFGMVIHELTHVVQSYPKYDPPWLVEGIADYIRYWHYEPGKGPKVNPKRSSYRRGYGVAAAFLAWIEKERDKQIVSRLNRALRAGEYKDELFKQYTGETLEQLWHDFVEAKRGA
jgi:hypothetical protein